MYVYVAQHETSVTGIKRAVERDGGCGVSGIKREQLCSRHEAVSCSVVCVVVVGDT